MGTAALHWKPHRQRHYKDNLSIYPDEPEFTEKFKSQSGDIASPRSSKQLIPHEMEIMKQAQTAK